MPHLPAIALDATLWDEPTTGISQYAHCLAGALRELGIPVLRWGAAQSGEAPRKAGSGRSAFVIRELPGLLRAGKAGLFHAVGNFNLPLTPFPGARLVLTVHDLIPELFPETVSLSYRTQFRWWLARSVRVADEIICVSQATAVDLNRLHPDLRCPVTVIHHGVDHVPDGPEAPATRAWMKSLGLPKAYVLYAGALDARKNVSLLLEAMERLWYAGREVPLVCVGQRWFGSGPLERAIDRHRQEGRDIRPLGYQPVPNLHALMRHAAAFVFPSRYEGFGLPPLEAMRLGAPVVVARTGALPEVCGEGALYVSPDDSAELAGVIERLLDSPPERKARGEGGRRHAARFTWKKTATETLSIYERALSGGGARGGD